jgi:apolipoprotein N-acyltransferase
MSPEARVVRLITAGPGATFYTRYGDWFGWADVLLAGSLLVVIAFRRQPAGRERIT